MYFIIGYKQGRSQMIIYGIISNIIGSVGAALGLLLQKKATMQQKERKENGEKVWKELNGIVLSPLWFLGFCLLLFIPFPADFVAYLFAPQSLIAPLGAITILLIVLFSPFITGDKLTKYNILGTVFILIGCVLTSIYGPTQMSDSETDTDITKLLLNTVFIISLVVVILVTTIIYTLEKLRITKEYAFSYGLYASLFGAIQNIVFKFLTILFSSETVPAVTNPYFYLTLIIQGLLAFLQISWLNKGLHLFDSTIMLPIYNILLILLTAILGAIFYHEIITEIYLYSTGIIICSIGIVTISFHTNQPQKDITNIINTANTTNTTNINKISNIDKPTIEIINKSIIITI